MDSVPFRSGNSECWTFERQGADIEEAKPLSAFLLLPFLPPLLFLPLPSPPPRDIRNFFPDIRTEV